MKLILIISLFIYTNANAQTKIDSVQLRPQLPIDSLRKTTGYEHFRDGELDSCWISKDSTHLVFRYFNMLDLFIQDYLDSISENIDKYLQENDYENGGDSTKIFNQKDTFNIRYYKKKKTIKEYPIQ